ncbi:MAG TPA: hypothetical protein VF625_08000, partial [Longimicrobium sp.]
MRFLFLVLPIAIFSVASTLDAQAAAGQNRGPARPPIEVEEGIDTPAAIRLLRAIPYKPRTPASWVFGVHFAARSGRVDSVTYSRLGRLPASTADSVRAILRSTARLIPARDSAEVLWVVVLPGENPILRAVIEEQPRIVNRREATQSITRLTRTFLKENREWRGHAPISITVHMRVDAKGMPANIRVMGPSPSPDFDAMA